MKMASKASEIRARLRLRVPGIDESIGAGDVVRAVTKTLGVKHCSKCEERRQALNRLLEFKAKMKAEK